MSEFSNNEGSEREMNWVSVKDSLPTRSGKFLVAGGYTAYCDYYDSKAKRFLKDISGNAVKYWMDIPKSPEGTDYSRNGVSQAISSGSSQRGVFPYNFYKDVVGNGVFTLPEDWEDTVEHYWGLLDDKTRTVLDMYYRNEVPLHRVGQTLGFSRQRAQQIKQDALRKMRQPEVFTVLMNGIKKTAQKREEIQQILETGDVEGALDKLGISNASVNEVAGISVRGRRVLWEQGVATIGGLAKCDFGTMVKWPSCGATTAKNISDCLRRHILMKSVEMG